MVNRSRAETLASYILPERTRSRVSHEQQPPRQKLGHTHTRSLSRHKRELAFTAPDGNGYLSLAPPRFAATNEAAAIPPYAPHLVDNFTTAIHPGLRRGGPVPAGHVDKATPALNTQPAAGTVFPPMPRAGSSLRRTKSSAGRPERKVDPKPPLPVQPSSGALSPTGSLRRPSKVHKSATHRVPHEPSQVLLSGPVLPKPETTHTANPSIQIEGDLASITCAAEMAVRRRVRSAPKSPSAEGTLVLPSVEKHRRSTSLGGEVLVSCQPLRPPRTTSVGMSASNVPPPLKAGQFVKPSPTTFPAPMPFAIPTRAPPPPPIVVPLVATKRIRSPPPPRQSSPPPPPPPSTLPKFASPSRSLPAPPLPSSSSGPVPTASQPDPAFHPIEMASTESAIAVPMSSAISPSAIPEPLTSAPTPPILSPLSPLRSPAALGPDSAYARFRARERAKTLASSLPTALEPIAAAAAANGDETLAETIAAIREAEEWDWPIPPLVHRPSPPSVSPRSGSPLHPQLEFELGGFGAFASMFGDKGKVEELRSNGASPRAQSRSVDDNHYTHYSHHPQHSQHHPHLAEEPDYFIHPFAAARYTSSLDSHGPTPRRGSDASAGPQNSGSSFASEHGPVTPDDYENPFEHPHLHQLRGVAKGSMSDRAARRYGVPF